MSNSVQISDNLYNAINEYRNDDETHADALERMARQACVLPVDIDSLDDLRTTLQAWYAGTEKPERILSALRSVYIGQEKESTIGVPHQSLDPEFENELETLCQLNLVWQNNYSGKHDFGYRTTETGTSIGAKLVREFIAEHQNTVHKILGDYPEPLVQLFRRYGLTRTDLNHLSTRQAPLANSYSPLVEEENIQRHYTEFLDRFVELGLAVTHSDHSFTVFPPEMRDLLPQTGSRSNEPYWELELAICLKSYVTGDIDSRTELVELTEAVSESQLKDRINVFYREGLTSEYQETGKYPFTVEEESKLLARLQQDIDDKIMRGK